MIQLYTEVVSDFYSTIDIATKKNFNLGTNTISSLFDRCLNTHYDGLVKLRIDLSNKKNLYIFSKPTKNSPICHIDKSFDFENYFTQNKLEKRKIILETLYGSFQEISYQLNYDLKPFTQAYEKVKTLNYVNKYIHGKLTFSRKRTHKAGIEIEINEQAAIISVVFTDKEENQIKKVKIVETLPHYMFIYRVINKGKWISSNEYQVSDKSGQINFVVKLKDKPEKTIVFKPKKSSEKELREILNKTNLI